MDYIKNEKAERLQARIKMLFKEFAPSEIYDTWADTFEIEDANDKEVFVYYHGTEDIKLFQKECKVALLSCIFSTVGAGKNVKFINQNSGTALHPKTKKNIKAVNFFLIGMIFVCIATAVVIVLGNYIGNRNFRETFYNTSSIKVDDNVRVIQLSDLHGTSYGKENQKLLERIEALQPDIILCTGDMVDSTEDDLDEILKLASGLAEIAPSYYIYGNNEVEGIYDFPLNEQALDEKFNFTQETRDETALLQLEDPFETALESVGIKVLKNEKDSVKIKTMTIDVYGVLTSNPSSFWSYSEKAFADYIYEDPDHLKITAIHEPILFETFQPDYWGDLLVCGHTHGGIMRIPVLGPLFTHEGGLFPQRNGSFVYGRYNAAGSPLIVSAGLENSNVLRINNEPELVVIDINKF